MEGGALVMRLMPLSEETQEHMPSITALQATAMPPMWQGSKLSPDTPPGAVKVGLKASGLGLLLPRVTASPFL